MPRILGNSKTISERLLVEPLFYAIKLHSAIITDKTNFEAMTEKGCFSQEFHSIFLSVFEGQFKLKKTQNNQLKYDNTHIVLFHCTTVSLTVILQTQ